MKDKREIRDCVIGVRVTPTLDAIITELAWQNRVTKATFVHNLLCDLFLRWQVVNPHDFVIIPSDSLHIPSPVEDRT